MVREGRKKELKKRGQKGRRNSVGKEERKKKVFCWF